MTRTRMGLGLALLTLLIVGLALHATPGSIVLRTIPVVGGPVSLAVAPRLGRVFVGNQGDDTVSVLDTTTGRVRATTLIGGMPWTFVVAERLGRIFVTDTGDNVNVLDTRSGALIAAVPVGVNSSPRTTVDALAVDESTDRAFASSYDSYDGRGAISMLNAATGAVLRTVSVGRGPCAMVVAARAARVFVANCQGTTVSVLDAATGTQLRTVQVGPMPNVLALEQAAQRVCVLSYGDASNGYAGHLSLLDARSGRVLRTVPVGQFAHPPLVDPRRGQVIVVNRRGVLLLDAVSGRVRRRIGLGGIAQEAVLATRAGRLFVAVATSTTPQARVRLIVLDAQSGRLVRTQPLGQGIGGMAVDDQDGRIFVAEAGPLSILPGGAPGNPLRPGTVAVFDARTGALLHAVTVGLLPEAVAVDATRREVFVVNEGCPAPAFPCGGTRRAVPWAWVPSWLRKRLPWLAAPSRPQTTGSVTILNTAQ